MQSTLKRDTKYARNTQKICTDNTHKEMCTVNALTGRKKEEGLIISSALGLIIASALSLSLLSGSEFPLRTITNIKAYIYTLQKLGNWHYGKTCNFCV